ncbi:AraC family transcriptional regulator [Paenibacillus arenilitoris]|uniref:Helix-turn-helix transcriptional regulator n=1 Tax=Paenibacillus arenilitoris TaxID=2772299 RepID=A0A927CPC5_9BACL|nr:AraC family transcriptional regulator [Paenibacillus arenilitoris]MBD2871065.1 helix-turn-helix transcriptional regulator [Paenibacillus arenilitoris]
MELHVIGHHHSHDKTFAIDRPFGIGSCWILLLIKTPAVFMQDGNEAIAKENSFILYTSDAPQHYRAYGDKYVDDWFYFSVDDEDKEFIGKLNIPHNTVTWLGDISEISSIVQKMTYEFYTAGPHSIEAIKHYLNIFFIMLSRKLHMGLHFPSIKVSAKYTNLINVRIRIRSNPVSIPSVKELANELSMSLSSFQHTYKKIFGVNVMTDIIHSRLQCAKALLATTDLTLDSIASQSGYGNAFHLMRQFKEKFGLTPTEYRKQHK